MILMCCPSVDSERGYRYDSLLVLRWRNNNDFGRRFFRKKAFFAREPVFPGEWVDLLSELPFVRCLAAYILLELVETDLEQSYHAIFDIDLTHSSFAKTSAGSVATALRESCWQVEDEGGQVLEAVLVRLGEGDLRRTGTENSDGS